MKKIKRFSGSTLENQSDLSFSVKPCTESHSFTVLQTWLSGSWVKDAYTTLRMWFDPAMEGNPYLKEKIEKKEAETYRIRSWVSRHWARA